MALRFPSFESFVKGTLDTLKRFPLPLFSSILASSICIYLIDVEWDHKNKLDYLWKIAMCCWIGLNLFLSMSLISERRNHGAVQKYAAQILGVLLLVGYYFLLPEFRRMTITDGTRYALFTTGLHLLVSFSPFIARGEINGFWQFNKTLFLRFLLSALYSGVLYLGLALALLAIDKLFNADVKWVRYMQLWYFLAGVFNTWFFLAGVPKNMDELETVTDYPKGLKIFTQFVFLPLVAIYLVILYAYGIKIIIQWELPKGWVSWLVNAFSVFGILSLLLIYPIRNDEGNKWISTFSRWFYRALFPLILLLGVAIGKRVMQYGITENRYFVLVVALWLTGIAIYFLFSSTKNIKIIPVTLFFIAFLSSFGPWSAFNISEKSQVNRLEKLLSDEKILVEGKIKKKTDTVSDKGGRQIVAIVHYLNDHHHFEAIKPWFTQNLDTILASKDSNEYVYETGKILALMGLEDNYYYGYRDEDRDEDDTLTLKNFYYYAKNNEQQAVPVSGFDYSCNFNSSFYEGDNSTYYNNYYEIHFGKDSAQVKYSKDKKGFVFAKNGKDVLFFDLKEFVKKISDYNKEHKKHQYDQYIPKELMLFETQNDSVRIKLYVNNVSGTKSKKETKISQVSGMMLLRIGAEKK